MASRRKAWGRRAGLGATAIGMWLGALGAGAQVGPVQRGGGTSGGATPGTADAELASHVLDRVTYGRNEASIAAIQRMGVDDFIREQLAPEGIVENPVLLGKLAGLPPVDPLNPQWDIFELYDDFFWRATYSYRQLNEVMMEFWENHFDTQVPLGTAGTPQRYRNVEWTRWEKDQYRQKALGRFRDILDVSAKSAAMSYFLGNYQNTANTRVPGGPSGNENYARELLELHTLGVDNGYSQMDVQEVARVFTGWTITDLSRTCTLTEGSFCYNANAHDNFPKTVLGEVIPNANVAPGIAEGQHVLDVLSRHPGTAHFICTKLCQKFVADEPPARLVGACSSTFLETDGSIREVLETILFSPEFRDPRYRLNKVKTPLEFEISSLRNLEGNTDGRSLWGWINNQGQGVFQNPTPTGWAEVGSEWIGTNTFLQRWKWADAFTHSTGTNYSCDPWAIAARMNVRTPDAIVEHFLKLLVRGHHASATEKDLLRTALLNGQTIANFNFDSNTTKSGMRNLVSLILGFPEYNLQ